MSRPGLQDSDEFNEYSILKHLDDLRGQPPGVISNYIESVKLRWVLNENDKTAAVRARLLMRKLEEMRLVKEGKQIMVDLEALALEREKRLKTLHLETAQLDETIRTRAERDRLIALKERMQTELEIAQIEKQIEELKTPSKREVEMTPEERRAKERQSCEAHIAELRALKREALRIEDEDERVLKTNAYDDAIQRETQRWAKLL